MDTVTGRHVEVEVVVNLPVDRLWSLVTDVPSYGAWSPEGEHTGWLDGATGGPPRAGDRFAGRNRYRDGTVLEMVCVVTEVVAPATFAWSVLDEHGRAASLWRYELTPDTAGTRLRHGFRHGPGDTTVRTRAGTDPSTMDQRLTELRENMTAALAAMLDGVRYTDGSPQ